MTAYLLLDHILNLLAPAACVALLLVFLTHFFGRFSKSKKAGSYGFWTQTGIVFAANLVVLIAGLVVFGNDGKMATYAALVFVSATCLWVLRKGWRS